MMERTLGKGADKVSENEERYKVSQLLNNDSDRDIVYI